MQRFNGPNLLLCQPIQLIHQRINLRVQLLDLGTPRKPLFFPSAPLVLLLSFDVTV